MPLSSENGIVTTFDSSEAGVTGIQTVPFTFTLPTGNFEFICASTSYQADATVGTRFLILKIFDDNGALIINVPLSVVIASQLRIDTWTVGSGFTTIFGIIQQRYMPRGLILKKDWTMVFDAAGTVGPGDEQTISFQLRRR